MDQDYKKITKASQVKGIARKVVTYAFLGICALVVLFPFYWMVLTSIKSFSDYNGEMVPKLFTLRPTLENYITAFREVELGRYMINTVIFASVTTIVMVIVAVLAAYAFARLNFKGKDLLFTLFLSLMIIPNELVIITNYVTIVNLNLRNTYTGLIVPSIMSVFYIYLLRQTFMQVPDELYYAAKVDGTTDFNYLLKVLVPIARPTLVSILILKVIECWNSFVWPRLITTNSKYYLVSNAIEEIKSNGFGRENIPAMMAAVVIVSVPLLVIFLVFRKQIMTGVSRSGIKG
ncbi:MAG: carbohydrate ABC transporter permease [Bacilli bacterium]|nr:carbohydrate ABC transporter permease [Bacilli bacterium]